MNIVGKERDSRTYDAIVVGSGISGGWAAKELCEKGLNTLLLERGKNVEHVKDYPTAHYHPWDFKYGIYPSKQDEQESPVQSLFFDAGNKHFFVNDQEHPYIQERPFNWIRGYQVGGRSLVWGRQCYRWSDLDFEANLKDGIGVDWPIRYRDIAPWYDYVERFVGVSGKAEGLKQLPDGQYLPPFELNCIEKHLAQSIHGRDAQKKLTIARVANLTVPWHGRGSCLNRNLCSRGCPYGGYFSSNSATLPTAMATGNLTLHPNAVVSEVLYDDAKQRAYGVRVIDAITLETTEYYARIIFLNASTIATTAILLNSTSSRFPNGLGNDSGELGHNLMDHHSYAGAYGEHRGFADTYYKGRRPCGFIIPRFRNLRGHEGLPFLRGYNMQGHGERQEWQERGQVLDGFGTVFKDQLTKPGPWTVWMGGWGECLPYHDNQVTLSREKKDRWGMPMVKISFSYRTNEHEMMEDIEETAMQLLEDAGFVNVYGFNYSKAGGSTVHEMGTARMGHDPNTSVLNKFNQLHAVKNLFVTDGSCMASSACQNPSLTYMALTARACHFAVEALKRGDL
ncbi:GMC family oxidoreductase [Parapedobacter sp. ISTM3]|uniref:GMC oxidoreductase n=1 Tax=Parapedobacter sp. ISTM3 TaxID=2800130 RepID=UPI001904AD6F|nr:GMC family oxidoreductase [Parapedobacter sp. ISTM3]MBK1439214.1 GMC family oxidoreductase [Parapedobacter sp. ISTM3]